MPTKTTKKKAPAYRSPSAKAIRSLRNKLGWTTEESASHLRVSDASFKAWEAGKRDMPPGLWALFVIQAVYVLSGNEEPTPQDVYNLRMSTGMNQPEFGAQLGTSGRRVYGWELGEHKIHLGLWRALRLFQAIEAPDQLSI